MNKEKNVIFYTASAGSGKTYQLSVVYLKLLKSLFEKGNLSLKPILGITFTNKACFEMKERIIQFLKEIALNTEKGKILKSQTGISSELAEKFLDEIFLNYDEFQIKTIDSFLLHLYRGLAYELGLVADFRVKTYIEESYMEKALNRIFEIAQREKELEKFLEKFTDHILETEEQLKMNIKPRLISGLKQLVEKSTYNREFASFLEKIEKTKLKELLQEVEKEDKLEEKQKLVISGKYYLYLFSLIKSKLEEVFEEEKIIYMGSWKEKLSNYLSRDFIPWIYVKMGGFEGIIIDEFQDTDPLQWEAMFPLIENLVGEGKFLVCAGDPKQSIFKWRGADPFLIKELKNYFPQEQIKEEVLNKNYRSSKNIVQFNNNFFSLFKDENIRKKVLEKLIFGTDEKNETLKKEILEKVSRSFAEVFSEVNQIPENNFSGKWEIRFVKIKDKNVLKEKKQSVRLKEKIREAVKEEVLALIQELKNKGVKDIAILLRKNEHISEMSSYLLSKGLKVIGSASLKLKESPVVSSLVSLLKFMEYPEDEIAFAGILTGGLFPEGLKIMEEYRSFIFKGGYLSLIEFVKNEFPEFWGKLDELYETSKFLNPYEFCRKFIRDYRIFERKSGEQAYVYKFLSILLEFITKAGDLSEFLEYWDNYAQDELEMPRDEEAIKVLSIHLAKGLEFKTVIIPLDWDTRAFKTELKLLFHKGSFYRAKKEELPEEVKKSWYLEKAKIELELLNLLYVAFTRAIENLYIIVPEEKTPKPGEIFKWLYSCYEEKFFKNSDSISSLSSS